MAYNVKGMVSDLLFANMHYNQCYPYVRVIKNEYQLKNNKKMKVHSRIYLVKDKFGNKASATCEESCDTIQICGLKKDNGEPSYFESDAYHLASHCVEDGLEMKVVEDVHDFDKLWKD